MLTSSRQGGSSLSKLRFLLGLVALLLCAVGLSGCAGGFGEFKPIITAQVQNQTVKAGDTATFTVAATGTGPITYQWYKNGTAVPNGTALKYSWVAQASDDQTKVSVGATNAGGTAISAAMLTVQALPVITTQPLSQKVASGQTATFTVVATGTAPLAYQWFENGTPISGAMSASYTSPAITAAGSNIYTVAVSNAIGTVTSTPATLTVTSAGPALTFVPVPTQTYGNAAFPVSATSPSAGAVTYAVVSGPATISGNLVTVTGVGSVVLSATQAASGTYIAASATTIFSVNPAVPKLSFAPVGAQTVGGPAFPVSATSVSNGAVTYAVLSGPATVSGNMVTLTGTGQVVLSAAQAASGNYAAATATATISAGTQTPTLAFAPVANQTYGGAPVLVSATSASPAPVTYTVVSGPATISGSSVTTTGVGTVVLSASQAASGGYSAATASASFNVNLAVPTLTFAPIPVQTAGGAPFTVTASSASTGAVTYSVLSGPATISGSSVTVTGNGTVQLSASQAANGNYAAATATTTFTVGQQTPTLVFAPIPAQTFGNPAFPVTATSASPGAVTYAVASGPATISGNTVTLTGVGTVTLTANQAASGTYAAPAPATTSFTVAAATPNLVFAPIGTQTAGSGPFAVNATSASNGAVTYTVVSGPATVAGNMVTVTGSGTVTLSAAQAASGNYTAGTASTTFTVGAQTPTLAFAPVGMQTYGATPFTVSASSTSTGPITYAVASGPATISGNTVTLTGTGTVTLTANQAASGTYAASNQATVTFTVAPATPTLTFAPIAPQTYGNPPFTVSATSASTGTVTYSVVSGPATIAGNTVTTTGNGTVTLAASQASTANYNAATANTSFTVGSQTPTLTFAPVGPHNFGDPAFPVSATSASSGAVTYTVISGPATVSGSSVTVTGAGTVILGASQAASGGYTTANATTTFAVGAQTPALTFAPIATQTYGGAPFPVSATSASAGAVTYAVVSGPATVTGNTVTTTGVGNVILSASQAANGSYATAQATTNFNVVAATPTLVFAPIPAHTYGDPAFIVLATSASSGPVVYAVQSGPATISGNTVTLTGTGIVVLTANQAASGNYTAAAQATASFTVGSATATLTFAPIPNHTFGDPPFTVSATSASTGTVTYTVASGPATISGNTVTITGTGSVVLSASQVAAGTYAAANASTNFTVVAATPTINFNVANQTFGAAPFPLNATSNSTGAFTYTVASGPATIAGNIVTLTGAGTVTLSATQIAAGNYNGGTASSTFQVTAQSAPLTFVVPNHTYGDAPFAVNATSNSPGSITYTVQSGPATISGNTVTLTGAGTVVLKATQAASGGYAANFATASFNVAQNVSLSPITPANSTVAPGNVTFNASAQGGVTGNILWTASAGTFAGNVWTSPNTAGTYTITATSADDSTKSVTTTVTVSKPVITRQPVSQNVCPNTAFSLSVTANFAATYQWYLGSTALPGATGATYNIGNAQSSLDAGSYTVQVSNGAGSVTSNAATIVVGSTIALQPKSISVAATQTAAFTVGVTGEAPFSYQWYKVPAGSSTGAQISGATGPTYITSALAVSDSGAQFYVVVKDACGTAIQSKNATLTVTTVNVPPTIIQGPVSQTTTVKGTAIFSVLATGSPTLTYQWYVIPGGSAQGTVSTVSGATAATYTVPSTYTNVSNDGDKYYVIVSNGFGQAVSSSAMLTVGSGIAITQQPQTVYTNPGQPATYSVTATSTLPLSYQWYEAAPGSSTFAAIPGATGSTYTQASTATTESGSVFRVAVSNSTSSLDSSTAALFVGTLASIPNCSTNWNTLGVAQLLGTGCGYQLVPAAEFQEGEIVWPTAISTGDVQLSFTMTTSNPSYPPADGWAVVFGDPSLGATLTSIGAVGQGLGAKGIPGLVVAFDDFYNTGDPTVPYVGVGRGETNLWENPYFYLDTNIAPLATFGATVSHTFTVTLVSGVVTVTMDGTQLFSGQVNVPPVAYLYVTSSTGGSYEQTVITNIAAAVTAP